PGPLRPSAEGAGPAAAHRGDDPHRHLLPHRHDDQGLRHHGGQPDLMRNEYWIVDWERRRVEVYRRRDLALHLDGTLSDSDVLTSPLLSGFVLPVADIFVDIPPNQD